jgi:DNA-binding PadR family transcriptional regulator
VSGYKIRKTFTEITSKRLSFGTLVPMLHRFEKSGLVIRTRANEDAPSYSWFLTPEGLEQLQSRLSLLVTMLRASTKDHSSLEQEIDGIKNQLIAPTQKFHW